MSAPRRAFSLRRRGGAPPLRAHAHAQPGSRVQTQSDFQQKNKRAMSAPLLVQLPRARVRALLSHAPQRRPEIAALANLLLPREYLPCACLQRSARISSSMSAISPHGTLALRSCSALVRAAVASLRCGNERQIIKCASVSAIRCGCASARDESNFNRKIVPQLRLCAQRPPA